MQLHPLSVALLLLLSLCRRAQSRNPLVHDRNFTQDGWADPHVLAYTIAGTTRFYCYTTHDFSPADRGFLNKDWRVFESDDLLSWRLASTLQPNATPASPASWDTCWATDGATRGGLYFWYLSLGAYEIGVVRGASPTGPWESPLHAPLINASLGAALHTEARDPCVFHDPATDTHYLVFGTFLYYIAKLAPDMISLAEPPQPLTVLNATSQNGVGILDDKAYMHRAPSGAYILSYGAFYALGESPYGPFTHAGTWVDKSLIAPAFRTNVTNPPGNCWCQDQDFNDRHGSFFSANGQNFWSSNDRSHSVDRLNTNAFRDTILTYVHYRADGSIEPVVIDEVGVGEYAAAAAPIQAENFFSLRDGSDGGGGANKAQDAATGAFGVHGLSARSALLYPHVRGGGAAAALVLRAANGAARPAVVHAADARSGAPLCAALLRPTGSWSAYAEARCALAQPLPDDVDIELTFSGGAGGDGEELLRLDSFRVQF